MKFLSRKNSVIFFEGFCEKILSLFYPTREVKGDTDVNGNGSLLMDLRNKLKGLGNLILKVRS